MVIKPYNFIDKNTYWFLFSNLSRLVSGFIVLGLLTTKLDADDLGEWYVIVGVFSMLSLFEMGIYTVLNRKIIHLRVDLSNRIISDNEFQVFVNNWWRFYVVLSFLFFITSIIVGLNILSENYFSLKLDFSVWLIYALGASIAILNLFSSAVVNSTGDLFKVQKIQTISVWMNVGVLLSLFFSKSNLLITAGGYLFVQLYVLGSTTKISDIKFDASFSDFFKINFLHLIYRDKIVWKEIGSTSIGMISAQLLTSGYLLILANYFKPNIIGAYGLVMQLSTVVVSFSTIWVPTSLYSITRFSKSSKKEDILKIFIQLVKLSMVLCLAGMIVLYFFGPTFLDFVNSKTKFPPKIVTFIIIVCVIIDLFCSLLAQTLMSLSNLIINPISLINALMVTGVSIIFLNYSNVKFEIIILLRIVITILFVIIPYGLSLFNYFNNNSEN